MCCLQDALATRQGGLQPHDYALEDRPLSTPHAQRRAAALGVSPRGTLSSIAPRKARAYLAAAIIAAPDDFKTARSVSVCHTALSPFAPRPPSLPEKIFGNQPIPCSR